MKKMRKRGRSKNHQELHLRSSVPFPTVECSKEKWLVEKKEKKGHRKGSPISMGVIDLGESFCSLHFKGRERLQLSGCNTSKEILNSLFSSPGRKRKKTIKIFNLTSDSFV